MFIVQKFGQISSKTDGWYHKDVFIEPELPANTSGKHRFYSHILLCSSFLPAKHLWIYVIPWNTHLDWAYRERGRPRGSGTDVFCGQSCPPGELSLCHSDPVWHFYQGWWNVNQKVYLLLEIMKESINWSLIIRIFCWVDRVFWSYLTNSFKKKLDNFTKSLFIIIATFWNDTCEAS